MKKENINPSIVAFSDTHKWNDYPQLRRLITLIDLENINFKDLKKALNKNINYTKRRVDD